MSENFLRSCRIMLDFQAAFLFNSPLRTILTLMKIASSSRLFRPTLATALAIAIICGLSVQTAQAGFIVSLQQVGPDVVATGSGTFDLTDLSLFLVVNTTGGHISPANALILTGSTAIASVDLYKGVSAPPNFGSGSSNATFLGSGSIVGVGMPFSTNVVTVPAGYLSGTLLTSSSTWSGATFSSLGVTPGTYIWNWGTGLHADSFTLIASVPDSGSTLGLLLVSLLALVGASRFRSLRSA